MHYPALMHYPAQPNPNDGHQMFYGPAHAPTAVTVERKKAPPADIPYGDKNAEFWCRELDGSWTLRTLTDIMNNCQPAFHQISESGWPVWYRTK